MKLQVLVRLSLVLTFIVIMLGAYTRLADAGLGCPDWPGCYGHFAVPTDGKDILRANILFPGLEVEADKAWLEMIHRYFAGTLGLLVFVIAFVAAWQKKVPLTFSIGLCSLIVFQALLGMWTVTLKLMPIVVMGHLLGGFALLSALFILYWKVTDRRLSTGYQSFSPILPVLAMISFVFVIGQIMLGGWTSSNYAALMCTGLPICEGDWVNNLDVVNAFTLVHSGYDNYEFGVLDYEARMTIHVAHRIGAIVTAIVVIALAVKCLRQKDELLSKVGWYLLIVLALQILLGVSNVVFALPLAVAVAHNIGAALLLVTVLYANYLMWQPVSVMELNKESVQ
ncbi:COX15/CtaA family protein [Vibrio sp. S4M6]|uniref:COX15/CtaA family protein n=1 Tax=Vibrio sinus TaxID=2946865 RepID=UPI00202A23D5|nr:COX15/CtaA family protein [Vibrio sinus]MCL9780241.1 COX15/CtaA family protein [Vibrio sinus]